MKKHTSNIICDPEVMMGKPVIKGTRITVEIIIRKLAGGFSENEILEMYPHLTREQLYAAFEYAADILAEQTTSIAA